MISACCKDETRATDPDIPLLWELKGFANLNRDDKVPEVQLGMTLTKILIVL
jgi:hypothetical protein